ncbi:ASN_collapsed_G0039860.mRNA.1.CDS.1 [Saccharomyces cerevisiae]|nr:ASN_collapsed_G0039860.mRNA.1.CDS.1 [Saccharomyces cerevisiae]
MSPSPSVSPRRTLNNKSSYINNSGGLVLPPTQFNLNTAASPELPTKSDFRFQPAVFLLSRVTHKKPETKV